MITNRISYRVRMTVASKTTAHADANARPGAPAPPDTAAPPGTAARDEPRAAQPRQLIVTVYGLYGRAEGGWMSVASLTNAKACVSCYLCEAACDKGAIVLRPPENVAPPAAARFAKR